MRLVIDANIVFAILLSPGDTIKVLLWGGHTIYAPRKLFDELQKHRAMIQQRTTLTPHTMERLLITIYHYITIIEEKDYEHALVHARNLSPDPEDVAYIALALHMDAGLWSNDKRLREQTEVTVYPTHELLK